MDNKSKVISGKNKYLKILFIVIVAILIYFFIDRNAYGKVVSVMQPIIIGSILAYLLNPLLNLFESLFGKLFRSI